MKVTADLAQLAADLRSRLPDSTTEGASFAELNTYRVGGPVAVLVRVRDAEALATVAAAARRHQPRLLVIGRGSNLLVSDAGFSGLVVVLEGDFETVDTEGLRADTPALRAGGAVPLPVLARRAAGGGLAGCDSGNLPACKAARCCASRGAVASVGASVGFAGSAADAAEGSICARLSWDDLPVRRKFGSRIEVLEP